MQTLKYAETRVQFPAPPLTLPETGQETQRQNPCSRRGFVVSSAGTECLFDQCSRQLFFWPECRSGRSRFDVLAEANAMRKEHKCGTANSPTATRRLFARRSLPTMPLEKNRHVTGPSFPRIESLALDRLDHERPAGAVSARGRRDEIGEAGRGRQGNRRSRICRIR